jgi:hypothetical protein
MRRSPPRRPPSPPPEPITPGDLQGAPELAVLDLLGHAVHVTGLALIAQHPHLLGDEHGLVRHHGDAVAALAEKLLHRAHQLDAAIRRYRKAVANACDTPDDDLPF